MPDKPPPIVAELGRPETPQETADRKAAASQRRRSNQTSFNLLIATIASLSIVLLLVLVVVRPAPEPVPPIDVQALAAQSGADVVAPELPDGWTANLARIETVGGVRTWRVGMITADVQFIALNQGIDANETWLSNAINGASATGSVSIGGLDWITYDRRDDGDVGNYAFLMSTQLGNDVIVLNGTASDAEFEVLASAVASDGGRR